MRINLPSGTIAEVTVPANDFPLAILAAEARREQANEDIKALKKMARQMEAWPVTEPVAEAGKEPAK